MIEDKSKCNQSHLWRMESIVEDVKDDRQTEGSPANSQSCKNLVGWNVFGNSRGVDQSSCFSIRNQLDDDKDSEAFKKTINN